MDMGSDVCCFIPCNYNGLRFSSDLWVARIRIIFGRSTWSPLEIFTLFVQGVGTLILFCVDPVSYIPYVWLWLSGFPLQLLHLVVLCVNFFSTLVLLSLTELFIMSLSVSLTNGNAPSGRPLLMIFIMLRTVDFTTWPSDLLYQIPLLWLLTLWVHTWYALH